MPSFCSPLLVTCHRDTYKVARLAHLHFASVHLSDYFFAITTADGTCGYKAATQAFEYVERSSTVSELMRAIQEAGCMVCCLSLFTPSVVYLVTHTAP